MTLPPPFKTSLAELTKMRRNWASLLQRPGDAEGGGTGRLSEVASFGANPGALRMFTFVPPDLPAGAPLVVVLHGCGQTAEGYDTGSGWSALAARHGFALVFPQQQSANNSHGCFNWFEPGDTTRDRGEVASIHAMVRHALATGKLDARRVFVCGLSAGGAMTAALIATYPETFAAAAVIAGLPFRSAGNVGEALGAMRHCPDLPAKAWGDRVRQAAPAPAWRPRVAIWHGDADPTVSHAAALASARQWCDVHGLDPAAGVDDQVDGIPRRRWTDAVQLFTVPGLGHGTPIDPAAPGDRGVGQAMPYMLESRVSSTWRIARDWGVVPDAPAGTRAARPAAAAAPDLMSRVMRAAGLG